MKIKTQDLNSAGIRAQAEKDGITEVTLLTQAGEGDSKITIYQFGDVRVADTNGDPVWEDSDPEGFTQLLHRASGFEVEVCINNNEGKRERFASVKHIASKCGADFYESGEELEWQDNNGLFSNCSADVITAARSAAKNAL